MQQTKVDILNFSRKLLLKTQFYNSKFNDVSLIKPVSNYIPKISKFQVLKSVINDLEIFANELDQLTNITVRDNLSIDQRKGLTSIKSNDKILYFKADKGTSVVLLDKDYYKEKVMEKLNSPNYVKLQNNEDYIINLKLQRFVNKYKSCLTNNEKRAITNFDYCSTNIYALPKIHKSGLIKESLQKCGENYLTLKRPIDLTFRVIFGGPKNPMTGLASLVTEILNPYVKMVKSVVRDSIDFVNKIPVFSRLDLPFIQMWSVDVRDMYSSIEHQLGLRALRFWLERYPKLLPSRFSVDFVLAAIFMVLDNNTGYFNGDFYKQINGTATGIKPAPPYANLVMGYLEIQLFYKLRANLGNKVATYFWHQYRRYLDDGQIMWDTRLGDFLDILIYMNQLHPSIEFTHECNWSELVFLDLTIIKVKDGFQTIIYNKETDSDSYLPFTSSHPRHTKTNIPFNLARRVRALTDNDQYCEAKMNDLVSRLKNSGYPHGLVETAAREALSMSAEVLRKNNNKEKVENQISFVHFYDPTLPQLFSEIKQLSSRIFTAKELRPIFGTTRIVNSQREPLSLGRILQHSRFDEFPLEADSPGVIKCGRKGCKSCRDILEVKEVYFRNSEITFKIKTKMDCTVRNVIYVLVCKSCEHTYIGETTAFRDRINAHRSNSSTVGAAIAEVSKHLYECGRGFWICPIFKMREENKIARLVTEDKLIKLLKPDLNTDTRNLLHLL